MSNDPVKIVGGNPAEGRRASDFYPTPPDVTQALLDEIIYNREMRFIWEPACGDGAMVSVMQKNGHSVYATDINMGVDFLTADLPGEVDWIITNPPFSLAEQFIRKCASFNVPFALLLKSQFWHAKSRAQLFSDYPPNYILPLTWRPDFTRGGKGSPLMDVMWCVWYPPYNLGLKHTWYRPLARPVMNDG